MGSTKQTEIERHERETDTLCRHCGEPGLPVECEYCGEPICSCTDCQVTLCDGCAHFDEKED